MTIRAHTTDDAPRPHVFAHLATTHRPGGVS